MDYLPILYLGAGALGALTIIQLVRVFKGGRFSTNFIVLFGLVLLLILATMLVLIKIDESARTAVFTLFGTIAGYLAGRATPEQQANQSNKKQRDGRRVGQYEEPEGEPEDPDSSQH